MHTNTYTAERYPCSIDYPGAGQGSSQLLFTEAAKRQLINILLMILYCNRNFNAKNGNYGFFK